MTHHQAAQKLPIGIQDFPKLIEGRYLYVDKTKLIYNLVSKGETYFLSRPRRFGKSLLVSTLEAIFEGRRELFKGLWIDSSDYNWEKYPVVRIDLSRVGNVPTAQLDSLLISRMEAVATSYELTLPPVPSSSEALDQLIVLLEAQYGKVVVLIDEYDKPLLDNLDDADTNKMLRDLLRGFYEILKAQDNRLRFIFLTGVSKFSQVSVFSGLNSLNDISMDRDYSDLLGYTQKEIEHYFEQSLGELNKEQSLSREALMLKIKNWYNGYAFSRACQRVYNPFSTLLLFQKKEFKAHWFATGTPSFLMQLIEDQQFPISGIELYKSELEELNSFSHDKTNVIAVLYQAGYLTIKDYDELDNMYMLGYPNYEVKQGFVRHLMRHLIQSNDNFEMLHAIKIRHAIRAGNIEGMIESFNQFLANLPYPVHLKREAYYLSLFYAVLTYSGITAEAETLTHRGRIDIVVERGNNLWVIECKMNQSAKSAMEQIHARDYASKYASSEKAIKLVGLNFNAETRQIDDWLIETLETN